VNDDDYAFFDALNESSAISPTAKIWNRIRAIEARIEADEELIGDIDRRSQMLIRAVVTVLSHSIRRQHLPPGLTFDSELWGLLRDLGGSGACERVTDEIERTRSMLREGCRK